MTTASSDLIPVAAAAPGHTYRRVTVEPVSGAVLRTTTTDGSGWFGFVDLPIGTYRVTTDSKHSKPVAPNVLNRRFDGWHVNQAWVAHITYIARAKVGCIWSA